VKSRDHSRKNRNAMKSVLPQSLKQALAKESPFQVIDVLTEQHFQDEHLPVAGHTCVYEISFVETATKIAPDKDREIALLGYNETSTALQAHFDLDRVQWDSKYGSGRIFEALGQHLVNDFISISF